MSVQKPVRGSCSQRMWEVTVTEANYFSSVFLALFLLYVSPPPLPFADKYRNEPGPDRLCSDGSSSHAGCAKAVIVFNSKWALFCLPATDQADA